MRPLMSPLKNGWRRSPSRRPFMHSQTVLYSDTMFGTLPVLNSQLKPTPGFSGYRTVYVITLVPPTSQTIPLTFLMVVVTSLLNIRTDPPTPTMFRPFHQSLAQWFMKLEVGNLRLSTGDKTNVDSEYVQHTSLHYVGPFCLTYTPLLNSSLVDLCSYEVTLLGNTNGSCVVVCNYWERKLLLRSQREIPCCEGHLHEVLTN